MRANCSTVIPAAIATAATWASSTARSPTTWQPMMRWLVAVDDEFAETSRTAVDDGAGGYREGRDGDHDVVILPGLGFAESGLGVLGVGEAADGADRRGERQLAVLGRRWWRRGTRPARLGGPT